MKTMKLAFLFIILPAIIINAEPLFNIKLSKLQKPPSTDVNVFDYATHSKKVALNKYSKYINKRNINRRHHRRAQNTIFIKDEQSDLEYYAKLTIGGQNFNIILDTGSSNLFVPNINCISTTCRNHNLFDPTKSKTFTAAGNPWEIKFGIGSASGITGIDDIQIGNLVAKQQVFGLANVMSDDNINFIPDGVLGLAFDNLNTMNTSTLVSALANNNQIKPIFGFHLSHASNFDDQGTFTLGGVDQTKFTGNINFNKIFYPTPVTVGLWEISLDDAIVNDQPLSFIGRSAIIDTGTSNILIPEADAAELHSLIPGSQLVTDSNNTSAYIFPSNSTVIVSFKFGGVIYSIPSKDLCLMPLDPSTCVSTILPIQILDATTWLLGTPFLKNVYSVFDLTNKRVGFATSS
ncbi:hypothetical protein RclHR1_00530011 [Rhizophagus clarus]|uniref:rhizopuspepsin n=1 Tax=Rhizophagus clarus TaxID=94130 RepID=A0A2Z6RLN8_9GLOM|nr:hypothetical protein RclHR1_00530011 [Rhizophagus clarus]GES81323.1 acid protease [Rhizophagus clarus]